MSKLKNLFAGVMVLLAVGCGGPMEGQAPVGEEDTGPDVQTSQGAVSTGYFNTYTDVVAALPNGNGCGVTQGFTTGSTYAYTVKITSDESKQVIYRTNMSDGSTTLMTNGDNGTTYATYLGHANDIVLASINSTTYMYVVTMKSDSYAVVKLRYSGTTFYKEGNYSISLGGSARGLSGIKILSHDNTIVNFLLKGGGSLYKGSIGATASSGTINVSSAFSLDFAHSTVNGSALDASAFISQGMGLYKGDLYVPLTGGVAGAPGGNVSVVLVYRDVANRTGSITNDPATSFRITSGAYPYLFEIESVSVAPDGKLWFATNRKADSADTTHDSVSYFNGF
jgi:hypothetical protein